MRTLEPVSVPSLSKLNTYPKFQVLCNEAVVVARVGIQVIRGSTVKLVTLPELASNHNTHRQHRDPSGDETHIAQHDAALGGGVVKGVFDFVP